LAVDGHVGILPGEPKKSAVGPGNGSIFDRFLRDRLAIES
jgi:hypothetical protein